MALWVRHNYDHLTVREVTMRAKVGYTTFYRHYDNLDDLISEVTLSKINELLAHARQQTTIHAEALAWYAWFRSNEDFCRFYVSLPYTHPTRDVVKKAVVVYFSERYESQEADIVMLDFALEHMAEVMYRLYRRFLFDSDTFTVEQVASIHVDIILNGIHHAALKFRDEWLQERPGYLSDASS